MLPVIAIVGRPNVGKSTLFNALTGKRDALVVDLPGVTRDRIYGEGSIEGKNFIVIDTGGITGEEAGIDSFMAAQSVQAMQEADIVLFLVDARANLTATDEAIAERLRSLSKKVCLVVNKVDGLDENLATIDFHRLGLGTPHPIAASHGRGVTALMNHLLADVEGEGTPPEAINPDKPKSLAVAVIGRPNVGKSTLVNRLLGEERVVVFDKPGTTRDSIHIPLERRGELYTLIDTAGVRKRGKIKETVEKFSIVKTLQAIDEAAVVVFLIDGKEGVTDQDLHLLGFVIEAGRGLVIAINKWDGLSTDERDTVRYQIDRKLVFANFARLHFISALHGTGVGDLFKFIQEAYRSATRRLSTSKLTDILQAAVQQHAPPRVHGRAIKLRYAHIGGHNPPLIIIHGNQVDSVPEAYKRYLINFFRTALKLIGTPIRIEFKGGENPFAGRRNTLTPRQEYKRKRLISHHKKKDKR